MHVCILSVRKILHGPVHRACFYTICAQHTTWTHAPCMFLYYLCATYYLDPCTVQFFVLPKLFLQCRSVQVAICALSSTPTSTQITKHNTTKIKSSKKCNTTWWQNAGRPAAHRSSHSKKNQAWARLWWRPCRSGPLSCAIGHTVPSRRQPCPSAKTRYKHGATAFLKPD